MKSITFCLILTFVGFSFAFFSCTKESNIEIEADTSLVAKIFQPSALEGKDAIIESFSPEQNFGDSSNLALFSWTSSGIITTSRILMEFNFSEIPGSTQIDSAKLSLFWTSFENQTGHTGENAFSILKVTQNWEENLVTWNNQPSTIIENTVKVPKSISEQQSYLNIDVTKLVQDMINNPSENHGFMLKLDEEFPYKLVIVASSDHPDESRHPKLTVYY